MATDDSLHEQYIKFKISNWWKSLVVKAKKIHEEVEKLEHLRIATVRSPLS